MQELTHQLLQQCTKTARKQKHYFLLETKLKTSSQRINVIANKTQQPTPYHSERSAAIQEAAEQGLEAACFARYDECGAAYQEATPSRCEWNFSPL